MGVIQNSLNNIVGSGLKVAGAMKVKDIVESSKTTAQASQQTAQSLGNQEKSLTAIQKSQEAIKNKFNTTKALENRLKQLEANIGHIGVEGRNINKIPTIDATGGFGERSFTVPGQAPTDEEVEFEAAGGQEAVEKIIEEVNR